VPSRPRRRQRLTVHVSARGRPGNPRKTPGHVSRGVTPLELPVHDRGRSVGLEAISTLVRGGAGREPNERDGDADLQITGASAVGPTALDEVPLARHSGTG